MENKCVGCGKNADSAHMITCPNCSATVCTACAENNAMLCPACHGEINYNS